MPKSENQCIILSFVLRIMPQTCSSCAGEILSLPHCACRLCCFGRVRFYVTLWTVAWQAPLSMGSFQQEHWSGLPCPPSGDLPHHGWKLHLFHVLNWQADGLSLLHLGSRSTSSINSKILLYAHCIIKKPWSPCITSRSWKIHTAFSKRQNFIYKRAI